MNNWTCITCGVRFLSAELHRAHFKSICEKFLKVYMGQN